MADLAGMIESLALAVDPVMRLMSGFCYALGINLFWVAAKKFNKMGDWRARGGSGGPVFIPLSYIMGGAVFIYLPTVLDIAKNTFFGSSPIGYTIDFQAEYGNVVYATVRLVNLAGLIWFLRGVSMLVHSSEQGIQHGPKGMWFMMAGIFALNLEHTEAIVTYFVDFVTRTNG